QSEAKTDHIFRDHLSRLYDFFLPLLGSRRPVVPNDRTYFRVGFYSIDYRAGMRVLHRVVDVRVRLLGHFDLERIARGGHQQILRYPEERKEDEHGQNAEERSGFHEWLFATSKRKLPWMRLRTQAFRLNPGIFEGVGISFDVSIIAANVLEKVNGCK